MIDWGGVWGGCWLLIEVERGLRALANDDVVVTPISSK